MRADRADNDKIAVGKVITFTCNGSGRGGHYHVTATVMKVNRKTVAAVECNRSYSPGTRWRVGSDQIINMRDPIPEHTCSFCKGTGKATHGGKIYPGKCVMCVKGIVQHESFEVK